MLNDKFVKLWRWILEIEKKLQNPLSYGKVVKQLKEYGFCFIGERIE
jgi:hypothetical protein